MLIGTLSGDSLEDYRNLTRLAPIQFIVPPVLWLSAPQEKVDLAMITMLDSEDHNVRVHMQADQCRHLLNPHTQIPGYYVALSPREVAPSQLRRQLGVVDYEAPFISNALLCLDGMQSLASRQFCRGLADALMTRDLVFDVHYADPSDPQYLALFDGFNEETQEVFGQSMTYS